MKKACYILLFFLILLLQSCTEPYALQTQTFESALVIEATITDEYKYQEVKLSRTYKLEEDGPNPETNAVVFIEDSNGNQYDFIGNNGTYTSQQEFQALPNVTYKLHVVTSNGETYTSTNEKMASFTDIENVTASVGYNDNIGRGAQIIVSSNDTSNGIKYYRYDYEETNKVIAPHWVSQRGVAILPPLVGPPGVIEMEPWPYEAKTCYLTENSKVISISNTSLNASSSSVSQVRFLKDSDYKIAIRYTIKVTMYNESLAAYNYYDALKKSSSSESLLSQNQPGFYNGNIRNQSNSSEKIIGFFDVSHVSSKRIFFNFEDLFPGESKPEYPYYCPELSELYKNSRYRFCVSVAGGPTDPFASPCAAYFIIETISNKTKAVFDFAPPEIVITNYECADCTSFSSNIKPAFWID